MDIRKSTFIGVLHLKPLPGSPRWGGSMLEIIDAACRDAEAYARGGVDAVILENFEDIPFARGAVPPETVAAMAAAACEVGRALGKLPFGFNVLRNDARSALGLCVACGGSFMRVNVHTGVMLTDQGLIQGEAYTTLRERARLVSDAKILADVHVKHAVPLGNLTIEDAARDTLHRGLADALIVTGTGTGLPTRLEDVKKVRQACPEARILIGSGVTAESAPALLEYADGVIVGTSLKVDGKVQNPVDEKRVRAMRDAF